MPELYSLGISMDSHCNGNNQNIWNEWHSIPPYGEFPFLFLLSLLQWYDNPSYRSFLPCIMHAMLTLMVPLRLHVSMSISLMRYHNQRRQHKGDNHDLTGSLTCNIILIMNANNYYDNAIIDDIIDFYHSLDELHGEPHRTVNHDPYLLNDLPSWMHDEQNPDYPSPASLSDYHGHVDVNKYVSHKNEWMKHLGIEQSLMNMRGKTYENLIADSMVVQVPSVYARVIQSVMIWATMRPEGTIVDMYSLLASDAIMTAAADFTVPVGDVINLIDDHYSSMMTDDYLKPANQLINDVINVNLDALESFTGWEHDTVQRKLNPVNSLQGLMIPWGFIPPSYYHVLAYHIAGLDSLETACAYLEDMRTGGYDGKCKPVIDGLVSVIHSNSDFLSSGRIAVIISVLSDKYIDEHGMAEWFNYLTAHSVLMRSMEAIASVAVSRFDEFATVNEDELTGNGLETYHDIADMLNLYSAD